MALLTFYFGINDSFITKNAKIDEWDDGEQTIQADTKGKSLPDPFPDNDDFYDEAKDIDSVFWDSDANTSEDGTLAGVALVIDDSNLNSDGTIDPSGADVEIEQILFVFYDGNPETSPFDTIYDKEEDGGSVFIDVSESTGDFLVIPNVDTLEVDRTGSGSGQTSTYDAEYVQVSSGGDADLVLFTPTAEFQFEELANGDAIADKDQGLILIEDPNEDVNLVCFFAGSMIATPEGERAVETLKAGDMISTSDGRAVPVRWLGRQTVATRFRPAERLEPVKIESGALGDDLPNADLTVTADHAMLVDGVLIQAGALVNGATITRPAATSLGETYVVYHIETDTHEVILANGAETETFIDNLSRRAFDNYGEYISVFGTEREMAELDVPRALSTRQIPAATRARLAINTVRSA